MGLQHAYERGLVHRDIKPHNLLLTAEGKTVKVLDMGLARLDQPSEDDNSSTMTQEGSVMGTPDYIAPEQAMDSHTVDIRADLYSLGCTFYYLLIRSQENAKKKQVRMVQCRAEPYLAALDGAREVTLA